MSLKNNLSKVLNQFAWQTLQGLTQNQSNLIISPLSLSLALSMVAAGATHETKEEMMKALHISSDKELINSDAFLSAFKSLKDALIIQDSDLIVSIANGVWLKPEYGIKKEFLELLKSHYDAAAKTINQNSVQEINQFVDDSTKHKIKDIIQSIDPLCQMVLVNCVYFKGLFIKEFDEKLTTEQPFFQFDGTTIKQNCKLMLLKQKWRSYFENNELQAIEIDYKPSNQANLSSLVILPKQNIPPTQLFDQLQQNDAFVASMRSREGTLFLPRFKIEWGQSLTSYFANLMPRAFGDSAQFSGMTDNPHGLKIGDVIHKTFVELNEKGTEAAAATAVMMMTRCMAVPKTDPPFVMRVDRDFIFIIRDRGCGAILFIGVITNP